MLITSKNNQILKDYRGLMKSKFRKESSNYLIEGIKALEEALESGVEIVDYIYSSRLVEGARGRELLKSLEGIRGYEVENTLLKDVTDTVTPQGIVARLEQKKYDLAYIIKNPGIYLLLENLQDPGNMGTIIRTADAFNIDGLIVKGGVDPFGPKVVRATMGSIFRTKLIFIDSLRDLLGLGYEIYSTNLHSESKDIGELNLGRGKIIGIGNEGSGISEELKSISDEFIMIPMPGRAESLNASVAASIIMYQVSRSVKNLEF